MDTIYLSERGIALIRAVHCGPTPVRTINILRHDPALTQPFFFEINLTECSLFIILFNLPAFVQTRSMYLINAHPSDRDIKGLIVNYNRIFVQ